MRYNTPMDQFSDAYIDFEEYIRQSEPDGRRMGRIWQTAIGLQDVDGLVPSAYLLQTAKRNIDGEVSLSQVRDLVRDYYETAEGRQMADERTEEADKVSVRIAELLSEDAFTFSPVQLMAIHRRLFQDVFDQAGKFRTYNIKKREWVLDGQSVTYTGHDLIRETLEYDFDQEKGFSYQGLEPRDVVAHFARFVSNLWQVHPFGEGNTRTTAVFAIKYLRTLGFRVNNELFAAHSWYFRNALVRANYADIGEGIEEDYSFLERFFQNLLLGENVALKNRYLHLRAGELLGGDETERETVNSNGETVNDIDETVNAVAETENATAETVNAAAETVNFANEAERETETVSDETERETENGGVSNLGRRVLQEMSLEPRITYDQLAMRLGVSRATIGREVALLRATGRLVREGSAKGGRWLVAPAPSVEL